MLEFNIKYKSVYSSHKIDIKDLPQLSFFSQNDYSRTTYPYEWVVYAIWAVVLGTYHLKMKQYYLPVTLPWCDVDSQLLVVAAVEWLVPLDVLEDLT